MTNRLTKNQIMFLNRVKYASRGVPLSGGLLRTARSLNKRDLVTIVYYTDWSNDGYVDIVMRAFYTNKNKQGDKKNV